MIFLLFIGSVFTLELILRTEARSEKKKANQNPNIQEEDLPRAPQLDFIALMQAVEGKGGPISPALPSPPTDLAQMNQIETQKVEA